MMGPLVIGELSHLKPHDKQGTVHPNDLRFQKETAVWESRDGVLVE